MMVHCMASGMLLAMSFELTSSFGRTVFFALIAHKSYESLTVSSVLVEKYKSKKSTLIAILLYSLSLPIGVLLTSLFHSKITQTAALLTTSLAMGTLLGCLIYDFIVPSLKQFRTHRFAPIWIALGLLATQFVMRAF